MKYSGCDINTPKIVRFCGFSFYNTEIIGFIWGYFEVFTGGGLFLSEKLCST